jgi:hypothetical protein
MPEYQFGEEPEPLDIIDFQFTTMALTDVIQEFKDLFNEHPEYVHPEAYALIVKMMHAFFDAMNTGMDTMRKLYDGTQ